MRENAMTTREVADKLAGCTLAFAPGSSWRYGTSADVLGAVVEVASGMKFFEKEGRKSATVWHKSSCPGSIKIIAAAAVIGFVWE